ncbi:MAG: potassium transporter TrkG [Phycisphaerae bacterium]|jgi:trk system potassium uptake protein TrkH
MIIAFQNKKVEKVITTANVIAAALVAVTFAMLFGYEKPYLPEQVLYITQAFLVIYFVTEKLIRFFNAQFKKEFFRVFWPQIPILIALLVALIGPNRWFGVDNPELVRQGAIGFFLVIQVIFKVSRTVINHAATKGNPTRTLIASFIILIISGAAVLWLPRSAAGERIEPIDALFTATSATCVTGLIVKDTGTDFSFMGQVTILTMIQLGGLGIVVFGAVFALLLGQAFTVRESVAMQDLLSARTVSRIGKMIVFIFIGTFLFEAFGAVSLLSMWDNQPRWTGGYEERLFYSIFHSISAFCNAGFSLFSNSFIDYRRSIRIYTVICPLIILGGLGFQVLYDLWSVGLEKLRRLLRNIFIRQTQVTNNPPLQFILQTKIVLTVTLILIVFGTVMIMLLEHYVGKSPARTGGFLEALFQSITARTVGFNTVDIGSLSTASRFVLILLMFIGGSPGSTAGGIKTVTFAIIVMAAVANLRKRSEVEMFKRSIKMVIVGRAFTVMLLFLIVLFSAALALSITERASGFDLSQIFFEAGSALGTVGLTTGITPELTTAGKLIIIALMLIGRLGPLTLLASLTFNIRPAKYNYADEPIIVG